MGSGEVGELIWRGGLGSSTGTVGRTRVKGELNASCLVGLIAEKYCVIRRIYRLRYGGTGWLRISAFCLWKGGRKTLNVQVDSASLQAKKYLGFKVLEGEEGIG